MVVLKTNTVPMLLVLLLSAAAVLAMVATRVFLMDRVIRKALGEKPLILLMGLPRSGRTRILEGLANAKANTRIYPFVGRVRLSDAVLAGKACRLACFHSIKDHTSLKRHSLRLRSRKPDVILFAVRMFPEQDMMEIQHNAFREIGSVFPGTPALAVVAAPPADGVAPIKNVKQLFGGGLIDMLLNEQKGLEELRSAINRTLG